MSRPIIATARWEVLAGDPAAVERGRWVAESATVGYLGILEAAPDDTGRVATLLRELATFGNDTKVDSVTVEYRDPWLPAGGAIVTAYGHETITSGQGTPEDTADDAGEGVDGTGAGGTEGARPHPGLTPRRSYGVERHTSTGSIAATFRLLADVLDAGGDQAIAPVSLLVGLQAGSWSGAPESDRIAAVDLLCSAVGTTAEHRQFSDGTWSYGEARREWQDLSLDIYAAPVSPPEGYKPPTCGPVPPKVGVDWSMTPRRRELLAAVAAGEVYAEAGQAWSSVTGNKVSARTIEALAAGWVIEGKQERPGKNVYVLTDAGREAAATWDKAPGGVA